MPRTGRTLWVYNPKSYESGTTTMSRRWNQRGVAYWSDGEEAAASYWGTATVIWSAVDAKTGSRPPSFGEQRPRRPDGGSAASAAATSATI